jgi:flavodoxin
MLAVLFILKVKGKGNGMKTLVLYYSYSGNSKRLAEEFAAESGADIAEIITQKRQSKAEAYTVGCYQAIRGKPAKILPPEIDFAPYDTIKFFAPVWAGYAAPALNAALELLPGGKSVEISMVSASGKSSCRERLDKVITGKGCTLKTFEDLKQAR